MPHRFRNADRMESSQNGMPFHQFKNSTDTDQVESKADKAQKEESPGADSCRAEVHVRDDLVHKLLVVRSVDIIRKVDQKLCQATFGSCVVPKNR
jgi:hypothetical protein